MAEWRVQLVAGGAALALALGGAQVADRVWRPGPCRSARDYVVPDYPDPEPANGQAAAGSLLALTRHQTVAFRAVLPPLVASRTRQVPVGRATEWDVAVLQLPAEARTLRVDFGDGSAGTAHAIPPGTGACVVKVRMTYNQPARGVAVSFTLPRSGHDGKPPGTTLLIDVVGAP